MSKVILWFVLLCCMASCSRSAAVQESDFSSVFTGVRGTYGNVLKIKPSAVLPDPSSVLVSYTTYSRPNLPGDIVATHRVEGSWTEGADGWWQIKFVSQPPPREIILTYVDSSKTTHTTTIQAPEPPIDLPNPENY